MLQSMCFSEIVVSLILMREVMSLYYFHTFPVVVSMHNYMLLMINLHLNVVSFALMQLLSLTQILR